jgi:hypothetical protein
MKKYIASVLSIIVLFLVNISNWAYILHPQKWLILAFFVSLDFLVNILFSHALANKRENFIQFYLSSVVIRMVLILIFMAFGLYVFAENRNLFVLNIIVFYLFFTFFEISILLRKLRRF